MRIETLFTPNEIDESEVKGKTVVVIDVLRVCTTMAYAMSRGSERIIPVASVEAATNLAASLDKKVTLLGGEREGRKIDGFDLGNSPLEYTSEVVKGKTIILATTNGTRAISLSQGAKEVLVCSFVNMSAVLEYLVTVEEGPVIVACAGKERRFAIEDAVCAGMLIDRFCQQGDCELNDGGRAARLLYRQNEQSIFVLLKNCEHGRYLESIGFGQDLEVCGRVDSLNVLPVVREGRIDRIKRRRRKKV
jgi:2-phosphosulfolactate phosphatase